MVESEFKKLAPNIAVIIVPKRTYIIIILMPYKIAFLIPAVLF